MGIDDRVHNKFRDLWYKVHHFCYREIVFPLGTMSKAKKDFSEYFDECPVEKDYKNVIKLPMSLFEFFRRFSSNIYEKLGASNPFEFIVLALQDIDLIKTNCITYNNNPEGEPFQKLLHEKVNILHELLRGMVQLSLFIAIHISTSAAESYQTLLKNADPSCAAIIEELMSSGRLSKSLWEYLGEPRVIADKLAKALEQSRLKLGISLSKKKLTEVIRKSITKLQTPPKTIKPVEAPLQAMTMDIEEITETVSLSSSLSSLSSSTSSASASPVLRKGFKRMRIDPTTQLQHSQSDEEDEEDDERRIISEDPVVQSILTTAPHIPTVTPTSSGSSASPSSSSSSAIGSPFYPGCATRVPRKLPIRHSVSDVPVEGVSLSKPVLGKRKQRDEETLNNNYHDEEEESEEESDIEISAV